jgi:proton glutamate symport protein
VRLSLTNAIFLGILLAVGLGLLANVTGTEITNSATGETEIRLPGWANALMPVSDFVGTVFLRGIMMLVAPLILTAIVAGVATIPTGAGLARLGVKTLIYYGATTALAVVLGLVLVNVIQPGAGKTMDEIRGQLGASLARADVQRQSIEVREDRPETIGDLVHSLVTKCLTNPFQSLVELNVLGIIAFALLIGLMLPHLGERGKPLIHLFEAGFDLMIRLVNLLLWTAPFGAFGLLFVMLAPVGLRLFVPLGSYMATVVLGLLIHGFLTLPLILMLFGRMSPWRFFLGFREALAVALSTSSSSATLPVSMRCVERNLGVPNHTASFVLPLGATVNMDGTALYEAVAAIFIAQVYGMHLATGQMIIVFITATFAAIGAAGIPSAGLVTMFMVFAAVDIPAAGIALIITVDRVLDMLRTVINVGGDAVGAVVIARSEGVDLEANVQLATASP